MIDPCDVPPIDGLYKWLGSRRRSSDSVLDIVQEIRGTAGPNPWLSGLFLADRHSGHR
jgi:hypothetical protein